jgi:hypothetical protein
MTAARSAARSAAAAAAAADDDEAPPDPLRGCGPSQRLLQQLLLGLLTYVFKLNCSAGSCLHANLKEGRCVQQRETQYASLLLQTYIQDVFSIARVHCMQGGTAEWLLRCYTKWHKHLLTQAELQTQTYAGSASVLLYHAVQYLYNTCPAPVQYMSSTCTVHVQYMCNTCAPLQYAVPYCSILSCTTVYSTAAALSNILFFSPTCRPAASLGVPLGCPPCVQLGPAHIQVQGRASVETKPQPL